MGGWAFPTIAALLLAGGVPATERGGGPAPRGPDSILAAAEAPALSAIGEDVIRFSSAPQLGGEGFVIEMHRKNARVRGTVTRLQGHPRLGYAVTGTQPVRLTAARYEVLAKTVDASLDEAAGPMRRGDLEICTNGPGYLTERRSPAGERWLSGFCGKDHPNLRIAAQMRRLAGVSAAPGPPR